MQATERKRSHELVLGVWGDAVAQERRRQNLTQVKLAELAGYPQSTISEVERGRYRAMTPEFMLGLAVALRVSVEALFAWPVGITDIAQWERA